MNHHPPNYGEVLAVVLAMHRTNLQEILSDDRMPRMVLARQYFTVAMHELGHSFPEIVAMLGRKSHSSAQGAYHRAKQAGEIDKIHHLVLRRVYEMRLKMTTLARIEQESVA